MLNSNKTLTVSAVFEDFRDNSHYAIDSIVSGQAHMNAIGKHAFTYLKLLPSAYISDVEAKMTVAFNKIWRDERNEIQYTLQPMLNIHLADNFNSDMKQGGSLKTVTISIALSLLLVLISSFNYINMSIAQAGLRAKEVGVRKVLGASKWQLVAQFLSESVLFTLLATLIACAMVELLLPAFNQLVGRELVIGSWSQFSAIILSSTLVIGLLSGLSPALFISSFSVRRVLSGDFSRGKSAIIVRKVVDGIAIGVVDCFDHCCHQSVFTA
ncbi:MAG: FtsX-like permease family protein [Psychrobium sp.]|nr:FtsX-like permease family protein [Psychrobium sp.]